ncbi:MAG TPA: GTPase [Verrucomicrobiales bacterium]|nr:GTPase [Verrucomicrobiales bacterium]
MDITQQKALLNLALHAAYADGSATAVERESVMKMAARFQQEGVAIPSPDPDVRARTVQELVAQLRGPETGPIAYEMAVSVCEADRAHSPEEQAFLANLRADLGLADSVTKTIDLQSNMLAVSHAIPPVLPVATTNVVPVAEPSTATPVSQPEIDKLILNNSILAGALELLPSSLATMAIIPVQMRLVYRVGKEYGYDLDQGHIKDLLATLGVGLTSQVVEGFVQRALRGVLGMVAGGLGRAMGGQAASSGMSFATTYALGTLAQQYYAGGRRFGAIELKSLYDSLMGQGKSLQSKFLPQIQAQASSLDLSKIPALLRGN